MGGRMLQSSRCPGPTDGPSVDICRTDGPIVTSDGSLGMSISPGRPPVSLVTDGFLFR